MPNHVVQQGEHVTRIAREYGFRDYLTVWNHPDNAELKELRQTPDILYPGDQLFIPEPQPKTEKRPTGATHTFQVPLKKLKLRIVLKDFDNLPIASTSCTLIVDGASHALVTGGDGLIECDIPPESEDGVLAVPSLDLEFPIRIGYLDPVHERSGFIGRLMNLGYLDRQPADSPDDESLESAIEEFQADYNLKVTGRMDDPTSAKLEQVHDSAGQ